MDVCLSMLGIYGVQSWLTAIIMKKWGGPLMYMLLLSRDQWINC
jgi:hypothetical protein